MRSNSKKNRSSPKTPNCCHKKFPRNSDDRNFPSTLFTNYYILIYTYTYLSYTSINPPQCMQPAAYLPIAAAAAHRRPRRNLPYRSPAPVSISSQSSPSPPACHYTPSRHHCTSAPSVDSASVVVVVVAAAARPEEEPTTLSHAALVVIEPSLPRRAS